MTRRNLFLFIIITLFLGSIVLTINIDFFTHGYNSNRFDLHQIAEEDFLAGISISEKPYEVSFVPLRDHFAGFEIYLLNQPENNKGSLSLSIKTGSGELLEQILVDLNKVPNESWYKTYTSARLKKGENYILQFSPNDCDTIPLLQSVDRGYLPKETISGNILLAYAYKESTFSPQNRILITLFISALWLYLASIFFSNQKKRFLTASVFIFLSAILSWNYMYNTMNPENAAFPGYQSDSETLVSGMIYSDRDGGSIQDEEGKKYGLGRYMNAKGEMYDYKDTFFSDDIWYNGYSSKQNAIIISHNNYTKDIAVPGNYIRFANGSQYPISHTEDKYKYLEVYFDTSDRLSYAKYGSLDDIRFLYKNGNELPKSRLEAYTSQYGLQGRIFRFLAQFTDPEQTIADLNLVSCILTAVVFVCIVFLTGRKYNKIMSACFYIVFWLSPWLVNFARNLYWVEFTWFLPMAIGLLISLKLNDKKFRIPGYLLIFLSIAIKSLCGYEYISTIMVGSILFLLSDLAAAIYAKNKELAHLLFKVILICSICALAGFSAAICIHARLKGNGSVAAGIMNIIKEDVLRRTGGADLNTLDPHYWDSLNASVWEVLSIYIHFPSEIIAEVSGNLFPLLSLTALAILIYDFKKKKTDIGSAALYVFSYLAANSWFILAKAHSYVHVHMNYAMWYFGFVQICFYIIIKKLADLYQDLKKSRQSGEYREHNFG